jgi:hypothetical protein
VDPREAGGSCYTAPGGAQREAERRADVDAHPAAKPHVLPGATRVSSEARPGAFAAALGRSPGRLARARGGS